MDGVKVIKRVRARGHQGPKVSLTTPQIADNQMRTNLTKFSVHIGRTNEANVGSNPTAMGRNRILQTRVFTNMLKTCGPQVLVHAAQHVESRKEKKSKHTTG